MKNAQTQEAEAHGNLMSPIDFAFAGIACHALCLLEVAGVLKTLDRYGSFLAERTNTFNNPPLIRAAWATLIGARIVTLKDGAYQFTPLGKQLSQNIGLLTVPLVGYRKLFEKQGELLSQPCAFLDTDIDFLGIAQASTQFCPQCIDPVLIQLLEHSGIKGTLCDLGCGLGMRLAHVCAKLGCPGLGIEQSNDTIAMSKHYTSGADVEIVQGDITQLNGVWEDVSCVLMGFVLHDIRPLEKGLQLLQSLKKHFPRMQRFVSVDIAAFSEATLTSLPGFDYVHGLLGFSPRTYEETRALFREANYTLCHEKPIPEMPNTFVWVLEPPK